MRIAVVIGTRPEIIKMQPIMKEIQNRAKHELIFIHTGQHNDFRTSKIFVDELELLEPNYFLNVRSVFQGVQIGKTIAKCEGIFKTEKPDILLVEGDTNSALGASIASSKLGLPIGHVEAGCRSFDKSMSEEINRVLISDIAYMHFASTANCVKNLVREGINFNQIFLTGHPIVDLIDQLRALTRSNGDNYNHLEKKLGISHKRFVLMTIHRRETISNRERIKDILSACSHLARSVRVVFPCHPHTRSQISKFSLEDYLRNIKVIQPIGYADSLSLVKNARLVLTDSGGIQQEAALLSTPCITVREVTEWVETVNAGINFLSGYNSGQILETVGYLETNYDDIVKKFKLARKIFGRTGVSNKIIRIIEKKYGTFRKLDI